MAEFFGLPVPELPDTSDLSGEIEKAKVVWDAAEAKREEGYAARREELVRIQETEQIDVQERLVMWQNGENVSTRGFYILPGSYMRIEGDEIVTTAGARVPVSHVRRAAPYILAQLDAVKLTNAPAPIHQDHTLRLGHYALNGIDADGTVTVGCHRFAEAEVRRIAALLAETA